MKKNLGEARKVRAAASFILRGISWRPSVGLILGSGLGEIAERILRPSAFPYVRIPHFSSSTVSGHPGRMVLGRWGGKGVAVCQGRLHFYEGHSMSEIVFPVRVLKQLGIRTLILTSAVGSLRKGLAPGSFVVLRDHLNWMGESPLRGVHEPVWGERFPDMTQAYDPDLRKAALRVGRRLRFSVGEGVYVAVPGPAYETPVEVKAYRRLGGDVIGMSVAPEVAAGRQMGLRVLGLAWVANLGAGLSRQPLSHDAVLSLGRSHAGRLGIFLEKLLKEIP
ncbi:MAG: purine-nucleoside phosphorylase [Elusimicrobia bacterium]|nr:purine-nucleoside phosphorylase [Elusimicrobiota bacterium]